MSPILTRAARRWPAFALSAAVVAAMPVQAQNVAQQGSSSREILAAEGYVRPPAEIERMVTAPRQQNVSLTTPSPDRGWFLKQESEGLPSIATFGKEHYYLGGLQVDFKANRARSLTTRGGSGLEIIEATTGKTRDIQTPEGASVSGARWSPDGKQIAYLAHFDAATHVYVADVASGKSRRITNTPVLATLVTSVDWTSDGKGVVTVLLPDGRKPEPAKPAVETGPLVRITTPDTRNYTRTYASLLRDPYEKELLEYYSTGQLAVIDAKSRSVRKVGAPAMISSVEAAPDGQYFRVTTMQKPFSYVVPYSAFGRVEELWGADGKVITELSHRELRETDGRQDPDDAAAARAAADTARRSLGWLPGGGMYYLQQDPAPARGAGADSSAAPRNGARRKDHLYAWMPPFAPNSARPLYESNTRMSGVLLMSDTKGAFVAENSGGTGHVYAVYFDQPDKKFTITRMRGLNASVGGGGRGFGRGGGNDTTFYKNPGRVMSKSLPSGSVALVSNDGKYAYLEGTQYYRTWEDSAPRPFIDRVEIRTGETNRIFESAANAYEDVAAPLDDDFTRAIVSRESPTAVSDYYLRDMSTGAMKKLTNNKDFFPEITNAKRERILVTRADGYKFWVGITLPQDYREGTRLPAMFWFYPSEYTDQESYDEGKRTENLNRHPSVSPRSIEMLVTQGYAVVQPDAPIVGAEGRMNDHYVTDLRNSLSATIDELDRRGYIDRQRLGLGGHSYGAFSTVNAMVHTPFFKAGIAGDGNYNRTLTPNGFQRERRDLWEGKETYLEMSPFLYADQLSGALLMYHSIEDQNVGTDPINSIRLLHALQGMGKTASLYMYPYEDHGPATRETILDQWARWTAWLDVYVKNAKTNGNAAPIP